MTCPFRPAPPTWSAVATRPRPTRRRGVNAAGGTSRQLVADADAHQPPSRARRRRLPVAGEGAAEQLRPLRARGRAGVAAAGAIERPALTHGCQFTCAFTPASKFIGRFPCSAAARQHADLPQGHPALPQERLLFPAKMRGPFLSGAQPHILEVERAAAAAAGRQLPRVGERAAAPAADMRECIAEEHTPARVQPVDRAGAAGLCERCAHVAASASRTSTSATRPARSTLLEGAATVLLDADFEVVAWDWWFQIRGGSWRTSSEYWGTRNFSTPAENDASMHSTHPFLAASRRRTRALVGACSRGRRSWRPSSAARARRSTPAVYPTGFRSDGRI